MEYRRLGRSGLMISGLVLGTMNFGKPTGKAESIRMIHAALDVGVNMLDCADIYAGGKSEEIIGEALSREKCRKDVLITSKVFMRVGDGLNDAGNSIFVAGWYVFLNCIQMFGHLSGLRCSLHLVEPSLTLAAGS